MDERYITGDAGDYEKFEAWAGAVEQAVGNPLYHWSHLELRRYFGYTGHLTAANARQVWEHCSRPKPRRKPTLPGNTVPPQPK